MTTGSPTVQTTWKAAALAAFAAACAWLLLRNHGVNPGVFVDEWYYSKMARLQDLKDAIVPSYLYLWIFRGTNACGTAFYECAQVANVLFLAAGAPFVYLVARQTTSKRVAAFLALLSIVAPISIYTGFFMPESTYYFGFCLLSWVALTRSQWHWFAYGAATGLVLGLMSLVKVHALFLTPALCLFLLYARWVAGGRWVATGLGAAAAALALFAAVKFGLGYLLAGRPALSLFGNFYQGAASDAGHQGLLALLPAAFVNGQGHLAALVLLLPLPLALIALSVLRPPARAAAGKGTMLQLYALLMLGAAAGVTILYTATIGPLGVNNESLRLHLRYYDFVFPLLWVIAAAALGKNPSDGRPVLRWSIALLLAAGLAFALVRLPAYALGAVDGPDLAGVNPGKAAGRVLLGLDLAVLVLWALGSRLAARLFLFVVVPAVAIAGAVQQSKYVRPLRGEDAADRAAIAARRYVPSSESGDFAVVGTDLYEVMRARFRIDKPDVELFWLEGGGAVDQYQLPPRQKWLLVLGDYKMPSGITTIAHTNEFTLGRRDTRYRQVAVASFAQPFGHDLIASAEGLGAMEPWGRWSLAKQVVLHLGQPLPRHARIVLNASAYGVNVERPFTLHVGEQSLPFRVGSSVQDIGLEFDTDGRQRDLVIDVPQPVPTAANGQPDNRGRGIGLHSIEIGSLVEPGLATN